MKNYRITFQSNGHELGKSISLIELAEAITWAEDRALMLSEMAELSVKIIITEGIEVVYTKVLEPSITKAKEQTLPFFDDLGVMDWKDHTKYNYAKDQLSGVKPLNDMPAMLKIQSATGETKWISLDADSIPALLQWLGEHYPIDIHKWVSVL